MKKSQSKKNLSEFSHSDSETLDENRKNKLSESYDMSSKKPKSGLLVENDFSEKRKSTKKFEPTNKKSLEKNSSKEPKSEIKKKFDSKKKDRDAVQNAEDSEPKKKFSQNDGSKKKDEDPEPEEDNDSIQTENMLIIDPAASTGYSVYSMRGDKAFFISTGYFDVDTSSEFQGDWCLDIAAKVRALVEHYSIKEVAIEDFFFAKKYATGSTVNCFYRAAVYAKLRELGLVYHIIGISAWKSFIAGRSNPTKEQKKMWGAVPAKKLFIKEAFERKYKIKFPEKIMSNTTNRPINFRSDIIDSNGQAIYFLKIIKEVIKIDFSEWDEFWKFPENIFLVEKTSKSKKSKK